MHLSYCKFEILLQRAASKINNERFTEALTAAARDLHKQLIHVRECLRGETYPLDTSGAATTLADVVVGLVPGAMDFAGLMLCGNRTLAQESEVRARIAGRIALAAEAVERVVLPARR